MSVTLICGYCKTEYQVLPYRQHNSKCCSRKCLWHITKAKREPIRLSSIAGITAHNNKQIKKKCYQCKKEILVSPSRKNITKFCSQQCYTEAIVKRANKSKQKYIRIHVDGKRVLEHRHVMELHLKRKLSSEEHVHHINHDKADNRIENLEVLSAADHTRKHPLKPF